ncbi:MAG: nicotinate (nicotinamide) nucleotide adenylyltransferase [Candidatus Kapabacteria bacterium]|nr:nicotinate (nicotinamide) nucleotide adenylyltransferase [Ignavibacteriota bacterium]MCW5885943.1 nicotinate (nicotinamide) nucleotide adenylyltransferase [Candidatus Kapabacteria bacterium]
MKIGIYGGSFNPVHNAHIDLAGHFRDILNLDAVYLVPAYKSPFKERGDFMFSDSQRIQMLNLVATNLDKIFVDDYEITKGDTSFTIDTINYFVDKFGHRSELCLLIGSDQWVSFHKWKDWKLILDKVKLCIAGRDIENNSINDVLTEYLFYNSEKVIFLDTPLLDISSENIRKLLNQNQDVKDLVPQSIYKYLNDLIKR